MIAVVDYGVGNLFSLTRALSFLGAQSLVTGDPDEIAGADRVILPGVGAFGDAIDKLREQKGMVEALNEYVNTQRPLLGICVGMQLLFEKGYEFGEHDGLGYLKGGIYDLSKEISLKVPHMGWNRLKLIKPESPILKYVREGDYVYYVHSFYAKGCDDCALAGSDYGVFIPSIVNHHSVYGTQFHPEKSGDAGLRILKAFIEL